MKGSNSKPQAPENGNCDATVWELRPGGMLVQKREDEVDSTVPLIKIKVYHDSYQHDVTVPAQSTFGELKRVLTQVTGLAPEEQRLLFRGKEKDNNEYLHMAGVKDMSKVVLLEDPASREKKIEQRQRDQGITKACEAIAGIRHEVDKLVEKVIALESSVHRGTKVADQEFVVLTELLMMQLLKLDGIEAEDEARVQRRTEVRRIQHYVEILDALKMEARNSNPSSNSSNGTSNNAQWQTFDSGRGEDASVMIKEATTSRVRPREPSPSHTKVPSSAHRHKRLRRMEPSRASTDWLASSSSQQLLTPDEVPFEPKSYVDAGLTIVGDFEAGASSTFANKSIISDVAGLTTDMPSSLDPFSNCPGEMSTSRELGCAKALASPAYTSTSLDISIVPTLPLMDPPLCHNGMLSSAPERADYESEIFYRYPSTVGSGHEGMHDLLLTFLRDLISNLDPKLPESLDRFTSDANDLLNFLANLGFDEANLRYWEAQCREVEFLVRQLRSLSIVRAKTSLSEHRQRVRLQQEATNIARDEYQRSVEAMQQHHEKSTSAAMEIESLSSKIKSVWEELMSLMSYKNDLQVECDKRAYVMGREEHHMQIRDRAMTDAKVALTRAVENLQAAEAEHKSLATLVSQLRVLQTHLH